MIATTTFIAVTAALLGVIVASSALLGFITRSRPLQCFALAVSAFSAALGALLLWPTYTTQPWYYVPVAIGSACLCAASFAFDERGREREREVEAAG